MLGCPVLLKNIIKRSERSILLKKQTSLETANEMYKMTFLVKKQKFSLQFPCLSESELQNKTVQYFLELQKD